MWLCSAQLVSYIICIPLSTLLPAHMSNDQGMRQSDAQQKVASVPAGSYRSSYIATAAPTGQVRYLVFALGEDLHS